MLLDRVKDIGPDEVQAWLRSLTDIRLSLAVRLGDGWARALSPDGRWVIAQSEASHLDVIPTGRRRPNPAELLANGRFAEMWRLQQEQQEKASEAAAGNEEQKA